MVLTLAGRLRSPHSGPGPGGALFRWPGPSLSPDRRDRQRARVVGRPASRRPAQLLVAVLLGAAPWLAATPVASQEPVEPANPRSCAAIVPDAERLACYDRALGHDRASRDGEPAAAPGKVDPGKPPARTWEPPHPTHPAARPPRCSTAAGSSSRRRSSAPSASVPTSRSISCRGSAPGKSTSPPPAPPAAPRPAARSTSTTRR